MMLRWGKESKDTTKWENKIKSFLRLPSAELHLTFKAMEAASHWECLPQHLMPRRINSRKNLQSHGSALASRLRNVHVYSLTHERSSLRTSVENYFLHRARDTSTVLAFIAQYIHLTFTTNQADLELAQHWHDWLHHEKVRKLRKQKESKSSFLLPLLFSRKSPLTTFQPATTHARLRSFFTLNGKDFIPLIYVNTHAFNGWNEIGIFMFY